MRKKDRHRPGEFLSLVRIDSSFPTRPNLPFVHIYDSTDQEDWILRRSYTTNDHMDTRTRILNICFSFELGNQRLTYKDNIDVGD